MPEKATRSRVSRLKTSGPTPDRRKRRDTVNRLAIFVSVLGLLGVAGLLLWRSLTQSSTPTAVSVELGADPSLNPIEAAGLSLYLQANQDRLYTPVGSDSTTVVFEVNPGEDARQIADHLLGSGLIHDPTLFRNYLRYRGLDRQLEAGTYRLSPSMTIPEIALALTDATLPELTVRITEGWRREQIADWIDQQPDIPFTGAEFLAATGAGASRFPEASLSAEIPGNATLEGFLFPDTYRIAINATPGDMVNKMLLNMDRQFTAQMRADAAARGLTTFQVVILASIVEREAVVPEERPIIASVYLNRLASEMLLQADPTVQYAMGFQPASGEWWNLSLTADDYTAVDSPYNTYLYKGLPPGPISNPGLESIRAVIYSADTPYLFFRATCDESGRHVFAATYEEHLANACP